MDRRLINTLLTLTVQFEVDGEGTDPSPDEATVTVTRADGTVLVDEQAASDGANGLFTYTIAAIDNDRLDTLTASWTTALGTLETVTEVAGGFLFSISELQAQLQTPGDFTTAQIVAVRTRVEETLEQLCGVAFVPRFRQITVSGTGTTTALLDPRTTAIRSVTIDGEAQTLEDLAYSDTGLVYWPNRWTAGTSNIVIGYEHGYPYPPERVKAAALLLAKYWLIKGPIDDRATSIPAGDGGIIALSTPGMRGAYTGLPEVDATIEAYNLSVGVA